MKINILKTILIIVFALSVFGLCGCERNEDKDSSVNALAPSSLNGKEERPDDLFGTWSIDNYTSYYFDGLGKGALILPNSEYEFKYSIKDNTLNINFVKDSVDDSVYEFKINYNSLTLKSKDNNKGTFELKKADTNR